MSRYLIACDSFKECLSSSEVAESVREGILSADPKASIDTIVIADGGEGFVSAIGKAVKDHGSDSWGLVKMTASDPLERPVQVAYGTYGNTAVIETASASGLALLSPSERDPLRTSTYGTGQQILDAINKGYRRVLVGLGGSATNDAGLGMLEALGFRFLDKDGQVLQPLNGHFSGADLSRVSAIDDSTVQQSVFETAFIIACDVDNPLYGYNGAAYVFGPQKGAKNGIVEVLDGGLRSVAAVFDTYCDLGQKRSDLGQALPDLGQQKSRPVPEGIQSRPGSGAAGGLGAAFMSVLGAEPRRGIELVLDAAGFDERLGDVAMVITGEGHMDSQTLCGKAPVGVLRRCFRRNIPVVAVCGHLDDEAALLKAGFSSILQVSDPDRPLSVQIDPAIASANIATAIANYLSTNHIDKVL